jgi:hypothetical protein
MPNVDGGSGPDLTATSQLPVFQAPTAGARDPRPGLSGMRPEQLIAWFAEAGQPAFRARQLADHVW